MTLLDLINKAKEVGNLFNTYEVPIKLKGRDIHDIVFEIAEDDSDDYFINLRIK